MLKLQSYGPAHWYGSHVASTKSLLLMYYITYTVLLNATYNWHKKDITLGSVTWALIMINDHHDQSVNGKSNICYHLPNLMWCKTTGDNKTQTKKYVGHGFI